MYKTYLLFIIACVSVSSTNFCPPKQRNSVYRINIQCDICKESFNTLQEKKYHYHMMHKSYKYACHRCKHCFDNLSDFKKHITENKKGTKHFQWPVEIEIDGNRISTENEEELKETVLNKSRFAQHKAQDIICNLCKLSFNTKRSWVSHVSGQKHLDNNNEPLKCYRPDCSCLNERDMRTELKEITNFNERKKYLNHVFKENTTHESLQEYNKKKSSHISTIDATKINAQKTFTADTPVITCNLCDTSYATPLNWLVHLATQKHLNKNGQTTCYLPDCDCFDHIDLNKELSDAQKNNVKHTHHLKKRMEEMSHNVQYAQNLEPIQLEHINNTNFIIPIALIHTQSS